ncbi:MAG: C-terminal helicase domain-containing protein, partial [Gemmatimonadales bacterium]
PIGRSEILAQFDPESPIPRDRSEHGEVRLVIATDLLSEGVNLQCASVIIHLDVPWTAARIEQRTGRLARLGSPHERVMSFTVAPPPRAEEFLRELEIIARKSDMSERFLGAPASTDATAPSNNGAIADAETIRQLLESWRTDLADTEPSLSATVFACAGTRRRGALGAWMVDGVPVLLATDDSGCVADDPAIVIRAVRTATVSADRVVHDDRTLLYPILHAAHIWYERRRAWSAIVGSDVSNADAGGHDARRSLARVADATSASAGFAMRSRSAALASRLRNAAATPLPLAVEWSLESLADSADDAAVNTILDLVERARTTPDRVRETGFRCIALILFVPETVHTV